MTTPGLTGCNDGDDKGESDRDTKKKRNKEKKKKKKKKKRSDEDEGKEAKTKPPSLSPLEATPGNIDKAMLYLNPDEVPPEMKSKGKNFSDVMALGAEMCRRLGDAGADKLSSEASKRFATLVKASKKDQLDRSVEFKRAYKCLALTGKKGCSQAQKLYETANTGIKDTMDRIKFNVDWMADTVLVECPE